MSQSQKKIVTLYGNLGKDPLAHLTREKDVDYHKFNPATQTVDTHTVTKPSKTFYTFSIAVKNQDDPDTPTWVQCIDWTDQTSLFRCGDRVRLTGYFQLRTYTDRDGEVQRVNQLVIRSAGLERPKLHQATREPQEKVEADSPAVVALDPIDEDQIPF